MQKKIIDSFRTALCSVVFCMVFVLCGMNVHAYSTDDHPNAQFSADGELFTIVDPMPAYESGADDYEFWYDKWTEAYTGIDLDIPEAGEGQHTYHYGRTGLVPVWKWECIHKQGKCIHSDGKMTFDFHGVNLQISSCGEPYFSGWRPICANCGEIIRNYMHYMSMDTASELQYYNVDKGYYYHCPANAALEQGKKYEEHSCLAISYNKYQVYYDKNSYTATGTMLPSYHMYNNATEYDGETVTPVTNLSKCTFFRRGYEFVCWTTNPDGTGDRYDDCAEILNLTSENYDGEGNGVVILYAQWKRSMSTLIIDPAGGRYDDDRGIYDSTTGNTTFKDISYGISLELDTDRLTPPNGYTVDFETGTDEVLPSMTTEKVFLSWKKTEPFHGRLLEGTYVFVGENGSVDTVTAEYTAGSIILPTPAAPSPDVSFGGWFKDPEHEEPVGFGGDEYTPTEDITLYASWVDLKLKSVTDLTVDGGKGGVDLSWAQSDSTNKSFKIYQKLTTEDTWYPIETIDDLGENKVKEYVYSGTTKTYTVLSSGFYTLEAYGAQGGNAGTKTGGKGGYTSMKVWLTKGDVLTVAVGGSNSYNGGGSATSYGNGGGMTYIKSQKLGTLLIAGGGGGAGLLNGEAGGSTTYLRTDGSTYGESGVVGGGGGYVGGAAIVASTAAGSNTLTSVGSSLDYTYTGIVQTFTATFDGIYQLEVWGAQGGRCTLHASCDGGKGGYAKGEIKLKAGDTIYIVVGGNGVDKNGYNGGGLEGSATGQNGGGATHIAKSSKGLLKNYASYKSDVYIVAGGGGSAGCEWSGDINSGTKYGGVGGGTSGGNGTGWYNGSGGTQTAGGAGHGSGEDGSFGQGGTGEAGGGGGWYGGGGSGANDDDDDASFWKYDYGAGGGSGYIGGVISGTGSMQSGVQTGNGKAKITCKSIEASSGGGGSNYVNSSYAISSTNKAGQREGNGYAKITANNVGYLLSYSLEDVSAHDLAAPDAVALDQVSMEENGTGAVLVSWKKPGDSGTSYNHQAISYQAGKDVEICRSNITTNLIKTGVGSYYYVYSDTKGITVTESNKQGVVTTEKLRVLIDPGEKKYLHLAPVDVAGNVGPTTIVEVSASDIEWGVITDQITISPVVGGTDYGSVYHLADKTYYVKADGRTPFNLNFASSLNGNARENYQVDNEIFDIRLVDGTTQRFITELPHTSIADSGSVTIPVSQFKRSTSGDSILKDAMNSSASRKRYAIEANFAQAFSALKAYSGQTVVVTPVAGASYTADDGFEEIKYSDWILDSANAITLILDGEAPVVNGLSILEDRTLIDRRDGTVTLYVTAVDDLSGVKDFYIRIYNSDNTVEKTYTPEADGSIQVTITEDEPIFSGDFIVTACAVDNVGNERIEEYRITEFSLETDVKRILEPHDPIFKCGESGILMITTWGYADRVEVEFPAEMVALDPELNQVYTYTLTPRYCQEEKLQFMVPLCTPENASYTITVRAYKGDKQLEEHPDLSVVEVSGSVLDEIRTRLR